MISYVVPGMGIGDPETWLMSVGHGNLFGLGFDRPEASPSSRAWGEALERYAFATFSAESVLADYAEVCPPSIFEAIGHLRERQSTPGSEEYATRGPVVRAREILSGEEVLLPEPLVTIAFDDVRLALETDSSGSAAHLTWEAALDASLLEFVERQSLICHWRLRTASEGITVIKDPASQRLLRPLLRTGRVSIAQISILKSVAVVLTIWQANDSSQGGACYAAGCAAGWSEPDALYRSVRECLQARVNMDYNARFARFKSLVGQHFDRIQKDYLDANDRSTALRWPSWQAEARSPRSDVAGSFTDAVRELASFCGSIFLYRANMYYDRQEIHIAKWIAPDLFLSFSDVRAHVADTLHLRGLAPLSNLRGEPVPFG